MSPALIPKVQALPPLPIPAGCRQPRRWPPPPRWWQVVVVAFSGGVDSHAALLHAIETYGRDRILVVYNDTGDEHSADNQLLQGFQGMRAFVEQECAALGVPLVITEGKEILALTLARGRWADRRNRYCTSGTKRDPSNKVLRNLIVELARERGMWPGRRQRYCTDRTKAKPTDKVLRRVAARRILLITGELAIESRQRSRLPAYELRTAAMAPTKGRLVVWHRPMLNWRKEDEILYIWSRGREIAPTYRLGYPRCSCRFCFFLSFNWQVLSFVAYPKAAAEMVRTEDEIGHKISLEYTHTRASGEVVQGFRAVGEFVYGDNWQGQQRPPLLRAWQIVQQLRAEATARLDRLREGESVDWDDCAGCRAG